MKKGMVVAMIFLFVMMLAACSGNQNEQQGKGATSQEDGVQKKEKQEKEDKTETDADGRKGQEVASEEKEADVEKNGRGRADVSRNEPKYKGFTGYVALSFSDFKDVYEGMPSRPWSVNAVEQTGEKVDDVTETDIAVPHKTEVNVLEQHLTHEGHGRYEGWLLVETVEQPKQTYAIDVGDFVTYAYWNREADEAAKAGPFVATYNGKGKKPYQKEGEVDVETGVEVLVSGRAYDGDVTAFVYREWALGYGGVEVTFDPASLDVAY